MFNSDRFQTMKDRLDILQKFLQKWAGSNYGSPTRKEVLKSIVRNYYRKVATEAAGGPTSVQDIRPDVGEKKI